VNAPEIWRVAPQDPERVRALAAAAGAPELVARLLLARGVETPEDAATFFDPGVERLHDPFAMKGVAEAADVLLSAARTGRRIAVFGDYDVDGVTSVAQLSAVLRRAGADAVAFLPHRLKDGYGLKPATVRKVLAELSPAVIVTVDCGITAVEGVACAREAGVEVVVTDHHLVPDELPAGAVVVNPRQPGCAYPYKELAAAGVALKIAVALAARAGVRIPTESLLRVACLGTIADVVPLSGENRVIAAAGLKALASARAPGLTALLSEAGVSGRAPTSEEVAFRVAPRLNAAGRLDTAEMALSLLEERDPARAREAASELSRRNAERQTIERRIVREAREKAAEGFDPGRDALFVAWDPGWHRGVLGIAAARLAREYHRPVLLFAEEGEKATGSGRSIPGVSLHDTLKEMSSFFDEFGGHEQAVGGSLAAKKLPAFREAARELFAARVPPDRLVRVREADAELPPEEIAEELWEWLARFEPHGAGNPRPVFRSAPCSFAGPLRQLGENGLRGRLAAEGRRPVSAITWERAMLERALSRGEPLEAHYRVGRDRYGQLEAEVVAARPFPRGEGAPELRTPGGEGV
jgi:single-stranded-DNA-specific exonuclease